ncbi:metal ion ABC transporter, permease protein [Campylobacter blaseri]|nr:metal ion ABC transporter, permease protein [Campylobacter blaseri]
MTPTAHIYLDFNTTQEELNSIKVSWHFSKNFTDLTLEGYDLNGNLKLDEDELAEVNFAMVDYLQRKNYLMKYEYYDMPDGKTHELEGEIIDSKSSLVDGRYVFEFIKKVKLPIKDNRILKIVANDDEGYFNFSFLNSGKSMILDNLYAIYNSNLNATFIEFKKGNISTQKQKSLKSLIKNSNIDSEKVSKNFIDEYGLKTLKKLKSLFANSAEFSFLTIFSIISISFLYGFFHAAGPGHAKMLTTSYFLANGGNYLKSFIFSLKIGIFHVIGAFLLVVVSMFGVDLVASSVSSNNISLTTKVSAIIIILVSLFLFADKIKEIKGNTHQTGCKCSSCCGHKKSENEWFIALSAAIIPCPGTILVFVVAFNIGSYFLSFISAIFMALGMSVVIFLAAVIGFKANKIGTSKFKNLKIYIEFFGIFLMLILGVFMFLIADKIGIL